MDPYKDLNDAILAAYNAIDTMGGVVPEHKNTNNLPEAIRTIDQGKGSLYGTITVRTEEDQEETIELDLAGLLDLSGANTTAYVTVGGVQYRKSDVLEFDTGDTLSYLPPYLFGMSDYGWAQGTFSSLRKVRFGRGIKTIPKYCFGGYQGSAPSESIEMVAVEEIEENFGYSNYTLNAPITFPSTLKKIGNYFLYYCSPYNSPIILPEGLTTIGSNFLDGCSSFNAELSLPSTVETIGENFLNRCTQFNQPITIPASLAEIPAYFMQSCTNFAQKLVIPATVTTVGNYFMYSDDNLTEVEVNGTTPPTDSYSLAVANAGAKAYTEGITITGSNADEWRDTLTIRLSAPYRYIVGQEMPEPYITYYTQGSDTPNNVYEADTARYMLEAKTNTQNFPTNTTRIVIHEKADELQLTSIFGQYSITNGSASYLQTVEGMEKLTTVTEITNGFQSCSALESITGLPPNLEKCGDDSWSEALFSYCSKFNCPLTIPKSWVGSTQPYSSMYSIVYYCSAFNSPITFEDGVEELMSPVSSCTNFNQPITIPEGVTTIKQRFLYGCSNFNQEVTIPNSVTTIGDYFMSSCTKFNSPLTLSENLESIGMQFLSSCSQFNQPLTLASTITSIPASFLNGCSKFNQPLVLPADATTIAASVMYNCAEFNSPLTLPTNLTSISTYFLYNCSAFNQAITIPATLTEIPNYFMNSCTSLTSFTLPSTVTSVGSSFLNNDNNLETLETNTEAAPTDSASLATSSNTAKMYTNGVEITGTGADAWKAALPNRLTSPYRRIVGNPDPEPYITYYTASSDQPVHIFDEATARNYMTSTSTTYRCPENTTRIILTKEMAKLGLTSIRARWPSINSGAYFYFTHLQSIEGLENLPDVTFYSQYFMAYMPATFEEVVIPDTVTEIGTYAFNRSEGIKKITIGEKVARLGDYFAMQLPALERVEVKYPGEYFNSQYASDNYACTASSQSDPAYVNGVKISGPGAYALLYYCRNASSSSYPRKLIFDGTIEDPAITLTCITPGTVTVRDMWQDGVFVNKNALWTRNTGVTFTVAAGDTLKVWAPKSKFEGDWYQPSNDASNLQWLRPQNGASFKLDVDVSKFVDSNGALGNYGFLNFCRWGIAEIGDGSFDTSMIKSMGNRCFENFAYTYSDGGGATPTTLSSLPAGSFQFDNLTTAGTNAFQYFTAEGQIQTLPAGSFRFPKVESLGANFARSFNSSGALTQLEPGMFLVENDGVTSDLAFNYFNANNGALTVGDGLAKIRMLSTTAVTPSIGGATTTYTKGEEIAVNSGS